MRIVSVNAWGGAMYDVLAPWLGEIGADVVCLQEVTRTPGVSGWTRFDDGERSLPQRANLYDDVRSVLPAHQGLFIASDAGPVTLESGRRHHQDFGIATYVTDNLPLIGVDSEFVHGEFVDHEDWAIEDRPRVALAARVIDRSANRFVTVVQLHGLRDPAGKHDTPARKSQADHLATLIERVGSPGDLTIVCGDLNLLPDSDTFKVLSDLGLTDLVGTTDTRTSSYPKPTRHASYLLISDPTAIKHFEVLTTPEVSDHRALLLDI
ncbi:endonuclease/exonuclease/phosphatase family metal-dependent hydrolase [Kribbella antiqua]|uniref:Endonuclease/exonuclease/phosphatase family metal-dependent hydrolase n=1 Tax=Kribbella antiqua TaxID=2512217 RepID=A0A4V2S3B0_9ACTN|nr:endonuclease/exonuclease/phosphatase family protein [Kribbella antiqua]TCO43640.1 endonuclease/exonuclease/phosphatase family metal-dependent hydrolase [Kribbella antiqua]